jgi:lipopolysaccharide/colanic/teichoic acid biosynthesis glycosyltransferase
MSILFERVHSGQTAKPAANGVQRQQIHSGLPRSVDFIFALIGLVVTSPLLIFAALVVASTSRGGIFFRQKRVGRDGRLFTLLKLRTMTPSGQGPQVTSQTDARITPIGKFLRTTKIDELPTLWNVLRGDMSLVGPRPEVPDYIDRDNPQWQTVLRAKPGITDPVTLRLRNEEKILARVSGDPEQYYLNKLQPWKLNGYVAYLSVRNWRTDLRALWQTAVAVIIPPQSSSQEEDFVESLDLACHVRSTNNKEHSE